MYASAHLIVQRRAAATSQWSLRAQLHQPGRMATDAEAAVDGADVPSTLPVATAAGDSAQVPTSPGGGASTAAAVVLDKLASLDVARRAERERRREESRAAADPRESITKFLCSFAARQHSIEDAIQRMLQQQQQQQPGTSTTTTTTASASAPSTSAADDNTAAEAVANADAAARRVLDVSSASPELVASSLEMLGAEVLALEQSAAAASYYLPAYDQKQCAGSVAALRAAIEGARTTLAPRKWVWGLDDDAGAGTAVGAQARAEARARVRAQAREKDWMGVWGGAGAGTVAGH